MSLFEGLKRGELIDDVYLNIEDVVLDELPDGYEDGDNSLLENFPGGLPYELRTLSSVVTTIPRRVVPYTRLLTYNGVIKFKGKDVYAISRALARAGCRKWGNFTRNYGSGMKHNVALFQERNGLKVNGAYYVDTHIKLAKYFDLYGTKLMTEMRNELNPDPREIIKNYAVFGFNNRQAIHYTQGPNRMYGVRNKIKPPKIPVYEDCSSFSTWCYWGSKSKDPNNLGYNGFGYTGTLSLNGRKTVYPKIGDLAFYGAYPYKHVVIYIGNNKCISHGSEGGPFLLPVDYRWDFSHFRTYF